MECLHCEDSFAHCPTHVYWCSPECWEEALNGIWGRIMPDGPMETKVKLITDAHYHQPKYERKATARHPPEQITIGDETMSLADWARKANINYTTLYFRIKRMKWPPARAISTPMGKDIRREPARCSSPVGAGEGTAEARA